jgi:hypothetical protein
LTLGDLGTLVERERETDSLARINGQRAVNFNVFKQQDANIVATGEAVKKAAEDIRKGLPPDVELRQIYASSDWVARKFECRRANSRTTNPATCTLRLSTSTGLAPVLPISGKVCTRIWPVYDGSVIDS